MKRMLVLLLLAPAACSSAAAAMRDSSPGLVHDGVAREIVHLHLETGGERLGGYTFVVKWDPELAAIDKVTGCHASKFPGAPEFSTANYSRGWLKIWGLTTRKHDVPGEYDLVTIHFRALKPQKVPLTVEVQALYDMTPRKPKAITTGKLNVYPPALDFTQAPQ